ncbi:hypothetical protein D0867_05390 [Hortaea werneckii]|uniref:Histidine kinase n=1 Tax=Hortaea werneckii TaxID=91943 RepID=A0A3M6ZTF2_HORWE|nr:hypothetical protein D0867_05390 [Hortaea werneckii]
MNEPTSEQKPSIFRSREPIPSDKLPEIPASASIGPSARTQSPFQRSNASEQSEQSHIQAQQAKARATIEHLGAPQPISGLGTLSIFAEGHQPGGHLGSGDVGVGRNQGGLQGALINCASIDTRPSICPTDAVRVWKGAAGAGSASVYNTTTGHSAEEKLFPSQAPGLKDRDHIEIGKRRRREDGKQSAETEPSSEPTVKKARFKAPKTKHTLSGLQFPPSTLDRPPLEPPSPLFFSHNLMRQRPDLPPRFSSSEAGARMLNNARSEDSHVKTVSLARGTVATPPGSAHSSAAQTPLTSAARSDDVSRRFQERSSLGRSQSPGELMKPPSSSGGDGDPMSGILSQIGVTELLEQDERPTFVVDLADSGNYGTGQLNLVFANSSLKSYAGMQELVNGAAGDASCSPGSAANTFLQFKSWLLSASVNGESLNVCLPSFAFGGLSWSCSTLRKRLRIIAGAFSARATPPASTRTKASIFSPAQHPGPISGKPSALEPLDYFTGTPSQVPAADGPSGVSNKAAVVPTIEAHAPPQDPKTTYKERNNTGDLIANNSEHDLSVATELLPSTQTYVPPSRTSPSPSSVEATLLMRTPTSSTVDSSASQIPIVQPDVPSFDWTCLPISKEMPGHIRFARSIDWASTSLGPIELWSSDLRQMCNLIMASPHPAAMYWGDDLIALYNEAYILLAGQKHPKLMGMSYRDAWAEIWSEVEGVFANARLTGEATMKDDDCLFIMRNGYLEETYFSWSIIPMVGRDGTVMGLYNPAFEKTRRKIAERRMLTLREVGERTASARDVKGFWSQVMGAFDFNEYDSPFLLLYSVMDDADSDASSMHSASVLGARQCSLEGALGVPEGHVAAPAQIDLRSGMEGFGPVFREVMKTDKPVLLHVGSKDLPAKLLDGLEWRGFGDPVRTVVVCPIHPTTGENTLGFLVLGVNPRRPYDDDYSLFVQLLSRQLATSLASVVLFEEEIRRGQKAAKLAALDRIELSEQLAARTQEAIESETKFTRMAEFAPVGMFIADSRGKLTYANDTWYEISRVPRDRVEKAVGKDGEAAWMEEVLPADRELVKQLWSDLVIRTKPISNEFRFKAQWEDRNGERGDTWVLFSAYPEKYDDGKLKSIFGVMTNISQQKWAEGIQRFKMEEAVELKRQQENFIDITSHEMRNPLSAILQCSDEIASSLTKFRQGDARVIPDEVLTSCLDAAQIINLCSQHQKRIVDDILTLSKLDSQLLLVTPVDAQPLTVVQRALKMHEGELQAADIQMKFVVDQSFRDLDLDWVRLDPSRVLQVLINLTTNAIKFTGTESKRTITVTIGANRKRPSETPDAPVNYFPTRSKRKDAMSEKEWGDGEIVYITFSVKDTGRGLNPEEKKMLFLRFSQASPRTHVQYGGSGLGLFISRELTELQGGEIGVESEAGKGSTFAFYVAARRSNPSPSDTEAATGVKRNDVKSKSQLSSVVKPADSKVQGLLSGDPSVVANGEPLQKRVLIVEDNLVNQRVLQKQLKNLGTEVHLANHGGEALDRLRQSTYWAEGGKTGKLELGVVLMDQEMPVMDGLTCTKKIRELEQEGKLTGHVPIIAVTANARAEQVQTALNAGMGKC